MSSSLRVALAQIISSADPAENLDQVASQTARAAAEGARLVIFPEATMRCFGRSLTEVAEPLDGPWATRVRAIAAEHDVVVIVGLFTPRPDGRVGNTLLATGPGVEACYDKVHLFDAFGFRESDTVAPGVAPVLIEVDGVTVGLATCYDVRFPRLFTLLADHGAEVIALPASWGAGPGKLEQWRLLTRARALDTTCYLVAAGQADPATAGLEPGSAPTGIGHSAVVAPDGTVLAELEAAPDLLVTDLDLGLIATTRAQIPVLANARI